MIQLTVTITVTEKITKTITETEKKLNQLSSRKNSNN